MGIAVVSFINFLDNDLLSDQVNDVGDWVDAVKKSRFADDLSWITDESFDSLESAKSQAFNGDQQFDVLFVDV